MPHPTVLANAIRHTVAAGLLALAAALVCCGPRRGSYDPRLVAIERIIREHSDSAREELERIDIRDFPRRRDRAKYALLLTRARHNTNQVLSDSLMHFAERFFLRNGSDSEKAQILYCVGNSLSSRDSFASAAEYYSKAEIFAQNSGDLFQIAAIHNALGYCYRHQMDYEEALSHFTRSADLLERLGWKRQWLIPKYQQIGMLSKLERYEETLAAVREAHETALELADTVTILRLASIEAATVAERAPDSEQATAVCARLLRTYRLYNGGVVPPSHYNTLGLIYFYRNKLDSARYFLTRSLRTAPPLGTRLGVNYTLSRLAEREGRPAEALRYERSVTELQDSLFNQTKEAMIQTAERKYRNEYLQRLYDLLALRHRYQTIFMILAIGTVAALAAYLLWFFRRRLRLQQKKTEEAMSYVDSIRAGYDEIHSKYISLGNDLRHRDRDIEEMGRLLEKRMGSLKQLLEIASVYESRPSLFYAKFKEYIRISPRMDSKWEEEIVSIANRFCDNLLEELRTEHPTLSVHELCYCSLICLGFTQQSIRVLYDHTHMNSVYSLRTRIRSKLGVGGSHSLDSYLRELLQEKNCTGFPLIR